MIPIKGLNHWKRQIKWKTEYDLARRFLVSLYKYRDALIGVRHPVMMAYQMPHPPEYKAQKASQLFQPVVFICLGRHPGVQAEIRHLAQYVAAWQQLAVL